MSESIGELDFKARIDLIQIDKDIADIQKKFDAKPIKLKLVLDDANIREISRKLESSLGNIVVRAAGGTAIGSSIGQIASAAMPQATGQAASQGFSNVMAAGQFGFGRQQTGSYTAQGDICPDCHGVVPPGASWCPKCGRDRRTMWGRFQQAHPLAAGIAQVGGQTAVGAGQLAMGAGQLAGQVAYGGAKLGIGVARAASRFHKWMFGPDAIPPATLDDVVAWQQAGAYSINQNLSAIHGTLGGLAGSASGTQSPYGGPSAGDIGSAVASAMPRLSPMGLRPFIRHMRKPRGGGGGGGLGRFNDVLNLGSGQSDLSRFSDVLGSGGGSSDLSGYNLSLPEVKEGPAPINITGLRLGADGTIESAPTALELAQMLEARTMKRSFQGVRRRGGRSAGFVRFGKGAANSGPPNSQQYLDDQIFGDEGSGGGDSGTWQSIARRSIMRLGVGVSIAGYAALAQSAYKYNTSHDLASISYAAGGTEAGRAADIESVKANYAHAHGNVFSAAGEKVGGWFGRDSSEAAMKTVMEAEAGDRRAGLALDQGRFKRNAHYNTRMLGTDDAIMQAKFERDKYREDAVDGLTERRRKYMENGGSAAISNKMMEEGVGAIDAQIAAMKGKTERDMNFGNSQQFGMNSVQNQLNASASLNLRGNTIGAMVAGVQAQRMGSNVQLQRDLHGVSFLTNPGAYLGAIGAHAGRINAANIAEAQGFKDYNLSNQNLDYQNQSAGQMLTGRFEQAGLSRIAGQRAIAKATMPSGQFARYSRSLDIEEMNVHYGEKARALGAKTGTDRLSSSAKSIELGAEGKDFAAEVESIRGATKADIETIQSDTSLTEEEKKARIDAINRQGQAKLKAVNRRIKENQTGGTAVSLGSFVNFAGNSSRRVVPFEDLNAAAKASEDAAKGLDSAGSRVKNGVHADAKAKEDLVNKQAKDAEGDKGRDSKDAKANELLSNIYETLKTIATNTKGTGTAQ